MMKFNHKKRRNKITITAIITVLIFAVLLFAIQHPAEFRKLTGGMPGGFDTSQDFVKFIDVGQGDCALIYSNGYSALIDVGLSETADDINDTLAQCGIKRLDAVVISHLHSDHVGGLEEIAKSIEIENLIMPVLLSDSISAATNGKIAAINNGANYYDAKQGMNFNIGEFEITLLSDFADKTNENNRSLFVMAQIAGNRFLFTGDAETKAEELLLDENLDIDCDVLKVSHHGSDTSSSKEFLNAVTPEYALISVGRDNIYSHPHKSTLSALKGLDAKILRTDKAGNITFNIEGNKFNIEPENK